MSALNGLVAYYREFGLGGVVNIVSFRLSGRPDRVQVKMPGVKHRFTLRMGSSDHRLFRDIFQKHEYLFNPPTEPETIIDAGANVGFASIYFANKWPNAQIVAIEPDPQNFELLQENTLRYQNILPIQAAVWKENRRLAMFDPGKGSWAMQTKVSPDGTVEGLSIPEIMKIAGMQRIDVLKMDIEGAELEVFENYTQWIDRVGSILVEIHDDMRPGAKASVMRANHHFKQIYNTDEAGTWYMLREKTQRPQLPAPNRGHIVN